MSSSKRVAFSLLVSTLGLALFSLLAFSGLFPWIEAQFYRPRVIGEWQSRLGRVAAQTELWKKHHVDRLETLLSDDAFDGVFSPASSRESLQRRFQEAKLFVMGMEGGGSVRILSADHTQIEFSTDATDVKVRENFRQIYRPWSEVSEGPQWSSSGVTGTATLWDPLGKSWYTAVPWSDHQKLVTGWAVLGVSWDDLRSELWTNGETWFLTAPREVAPHAYVISALGSPLDSVLLERVRQLVSKSGLPSVERLAQSSGAAVDLIHHGDWNVVVPDQQLKMPAALEATVLVSLYSVFFLVAFLLINLRPTTEAVVARRVKRFQLQVVRQYIDLREHDKIKSLREEFSRHSNEIRSDIRRSLGRIRRQDREWVDKYIDTSWQEVMDMLRGPSPPESNSETADWKRLETLLQQALTQGRFVVSEAPARSAPRGNAQSQTARTIKTSHPSAQSVVPVNEVPDAESVEDLEDVEDAEAVEELEDVEDAEVVEELEDVEEAEAAEDLEDVEDAEAVEELEDVEEAEAVEDLEDVEDAEAVEELEDVEEAEAVEELEDVEDAEAVEELEDVESAEAVEDLEDLEDIEDEEVVEELEDVEDAEVVEDVEEVEELEVVADDRSAEEVEPIVPSSRAELPFFAQRQASWHQDRVEGNLENSDEADEYDLSQGDDLEELEALDSEMPVPDTLLSLEDLDSHWASGREAVFEESDDVVRISDSVFALQTRPQDELGALVDDVLQESHVGSEFEPLYDDSLPISVRREWQWTAAGFDWARFALGTDEVNLFRALSELVSEFDTFLAAILIPRDEGWTARSSVGFSDAGKTKLDFSSTSQFAKDYLAHQGLHLLKGGDTHPVLKEVFHQKDLKFLQSLVLVPLLFEQRSCWLMLGLRREPGDLYAWLAPRRLN